MIGNYFLTTIRMLWRHKLYSIINILSLAVGLVAALFIYFYVDYETNFDTHWPDGERIYRPHTDLQVPNAPRLFDAWVPYQLEDTLERNFPNAIEAAGSASWGKDIMRFEDVLLEQPTLAPFKGFLDVLPFTSVTGETLADFTDYSTIYISESTAEKYYGGSEQALGQTVQIDVGDGKGLLDYAVGGVFKETPARSHLQVQVIRPYNPAELGTRLQQNWTRFTVFTYIKLREGAHIEDITSRMPQVERDNIPPYTYENGNVLDVAEHMEFQFYPIDELHMIDARGELSGLLAPPRGDPTTVKSLTAVGAAILLIAVINFINLTTARAGLRAREVALRKTLGAEKGQLVSQFLIDALILTTIASAFAVIVAVLALPHYEAALNRDLVTSLWGDAKIWGLLISLIFTITLIGGLYPAYYLARFQPADVLRANKSSTSRAGLRLRQALVIVQFAASIALITLTSVVYLQTQHARAFTKGFDLDNQLIMGGFRAIGEDVRHQQVEALHTRLGRIPGVIAVTRNRALPNKDLLHFFRTSQSGENNEELLFESAVADGYYDDVFGLKVLAGRFLSPGVETDVYPSEDIARTDFNVVVTRKALEVINVETPQEAIGQIITADVLKSDGKSYQANTTIVGVVEDMQFGSIRDTIEPTIFINAPLKYHDMALRFSGRQGPEIKRQVEEVWKEVMPGYPSNVRYLNQEISALYDEDEKRGTLFAAFALLAVIIACIGLFGLSAFSIEQRTKEIGMRKVLGADTTQITGLLSWQFSRFALIANVIGWPVAWFAANTWLEGFASRIDLGPLPFIGAAALAFVIAWGTVAAYAVRAATRNPVHSLRTE